MIFALSTAAYGIIGIAVTVCVSAMSQRPLPPSGTIFITFLWPLYVAARLWEGARK